MLNISIAESDFFANARPLGKSKTKVNKTEEKVFI
jgi:hypothetical protein